MGSVAYKFNRNTVAEVRSSSKELGLV